MRNILANRRQLALLGGLLVVLVLALVKMRGGPASRGTVGSTEVRTAVPGEEDRTPSVRPRGGRAEKKVNPDDIPYFTARDFDPARSGQAPGGRNIFDLRAPTPTLPPPPTPAPPPPPAPGDSRFIGPLPAPPPTPTPRPPEISFKLLGTFGPRERPIAVLAQGPDTVNAREGDIVFQHFIVRKIGYESIDVGYVGRDPKESRRVGLTQ